MSVVQILAPLFAGQAVNSLIVGIGIALLTAFGMRVFTRQDSSARFLILYSALLVTVAGFFLYRTDRGSIVGRPAEIVVSMRWATYFFAIWAGIAVVGLARIVAGLWHLVELRRCMSVLPESEIAKIAGPAGFASTRSAKICVSDRVRVPTAIGFFSPAVVLPPWALNELTAEELRTAILHELAHVGRWDDWTNLLQKVIRALFFFHPAVWWIDSRLAIEREMCCDDTVLANVANPRRYAECLVTLAEKSVRRRSMILAHAAVGRVKETALRVSRILNEKKTTGVGGWKPAMVAVGVLGALTLAAAWYTPRLVTFEDTATNPVVAARVEAARAIAVPASMESESAAKLASGRIARSVKHVRKAAPAAPNAANPTVEVAAVPGGRHPMVVNAAVKEPSTPEFMFVVFQTDGYDEYGRLTVTTTVWRVRLRSAPTHAEGTIPHST